MSTNDVRGGWLGRQFPVTAATTTAAAANREVRRSDAARPGAALYRPDNRTATERRGDAGASEFNRRVTAGISRATATSQRNATAAQAYAQRFVDSEQGRNTVLNNLRDRYGSDSPYGNNPQANARIREIERQAVFDRVYQAQYRRLTNSTNAATRANARSTSDETAPPRPAAAGRAATTATNRGTAAGRTAPQERTGRSTTPATGDFPRPSETGQPTELEANSRSTVSTVGNSSTQFFNISSFRSEILENDVLPTHSYLVTFAPFRNGDGNDQYRENFPLTSFVRDKRNTLLLRCENVVLPTPALLEEENIRRYGYGPVEKVPYGVQFSDLSITWLVDKNSEIIDFMHQWLNTIVMHDSPNRFLQRGGASTRTGLDGYAPFEVGYKDAYTNPIVRVYVYNREQQTVTEYEMYDVFPMNIQSMNLSWADENQLQKLTVTFAYTNMKMSAPRKSAAPQTNFFEEERLNANEERQQPQDVGGRAAADSAAAPIDEFITRSFNSELPGASPAPINPIPAVLAAPTLEVRDFTI